MKFIDYKNNDIFRDATRINDRMLPIQQAINYSIRVGTVSGVYPLEGIKLLLESGVDTAVTYDGMTPLIQAAISGAVNVVCLLIASGADVFQTSGPRCSTALQILFMITQQHDMWLSPDTHSPQRRALAENRHRIVQILEEEMDRVCAVESRNIAFAMGNHNRVGQSSPLIDLDPGVIDMIGLYLTPEHRREGYHM